MKCKVCGSDAAVSLRSHNAGFCEKCFLDFFRRQLRRGIEHQNLFSHEEKILVALSGGKDSLSLMLELSLMGYNVTGLFIDLGIPGSSAEARNIVETFCKVNNLPLLIKDLEEEGLAIPLVKKFLHRPVCSMCGKIKRYFFNKTALEGGFDCLATGHNLDDEASRLFSNVLRWDVAYLSDQGPRLDEEAGFVRKVKPLWRISEFETANYAHIRNIPHHTAVCPYSGGATFGALKGLLYDLEEQMPGRKLEFYQGFLQTGRKPFKDSAPKDSFLLHPCKECGALTSAEEFCGVCRARMVIAERHKQEKC